MMPDLVKMVGAISFTRCSNLTEGKYLAPGRTLRYRDGTVSRLWLNTSGFAAATTSSAPSLRRKSGVRISMVVAGQRARMARMGCAKCPAPPSARSSRSTEVITIWASPSLKVASATCAGSATSSAPGMPVLTLQKAQARVQVSPMIMKVACFLSQHSPILGQPASSQTVTRPFSLTIRRVSAYPRVFGARTRIQSGFGGDSASGRFTFSGWRGRSGVAETVSTTTTIGNPSLDRPLANPVEEEPQPLALAVVRSYHTGRNGPKSHRSHAKAWQAAQTRLLCPQRPRGRARPGRRHAAGERRRWHHRRARGLSPHRPGRAFLPRADAAQQRDVRA